MNHPAEVLLNARDVAERLGVELITFRIWCSEGTFPRPARTTNGRQGYLWTGQQIAPWVAVYQARRTAEAQRQALIAQAREERLQSA